MLRITTPTGQREDPFSPTVRQQDVGGGRVDKVADGRGVAVPHYGQRGIPLHDAAEPFAEEAMVIEDGATRMGGAADVPGGS